METNDGRAFEDGASEIRNIQHLISALDAQDALIAEGDRNQGVVVPIPQLVTIKQIFQEISAYRSDLVRPFQHHGSPMGVRSQLKDARIRLQTRLTDLAFGGPSGGSTTPMVHTPTITLPTPDPRRVFVIHGRNADARKAIFDFLARINLDPIEWEEAIAMTASASPSTLTAIERAFSIAQAAVVILGGDDLARLGKRYLTPHDQVHERNLTRQARPNVIFEAGMALGHYPTRTVIVSFGRTRPISDIDGINILYLTNTAESRHKLAGRLKNAECAVVTDGKTDWIAAGRLHGGVLRRPGSSPNRQTRSASNNEPSRIARRRCEV